MKLRRNIPWTVSVGLTAALLMAPAGHAEVYRLNRLASVNGTGDQAVAMARTPNGALHLIYQTYAGGTVTGLATIKITSDGVVLTAVQALSGWQAGQPALVALPSGTLEAFFGAISPGDVPDLWAITSSDDGATWSPPASVSSGIDEPFDYGADISAATLGGSPVITLSQAGGLTVQQGLGPGSPTYGITTSSDDDAGDAAAGVDAATGEIVDGWDSIASPGGDFIQGVAPSIGTPELVPGQTHTQMILAGRDTGPGVFAAYSTDGTHVRLLRYGGASMPVGSLSGVTAENLAVATGPDGRIWVMWGADTAGGFAVTRSNKSDTAFEPIQRVDANAFSLWRISGDGDLGPLDLFADMIATAKTLLSPGDYHVRAFPELSASVSAAKQTNKLGHLTGYLLKVTVTDAGDAVSGATVIAANHKTTTDVAGTAKLAVPVIAKGELEVGISDPTYLHLIKKITL
ncbi:MAG: hypothetical protein ACLP50_23185 [Solirubrobacteraceae bacterium]